MERIDYSTRKTKTCFQFFIPSAGRLIHVAYHWIDDIDNHFISQIEVWWVERTLETWDLGNSAFSDMQNREQTRTDAASIPYSVNARCERTVVLVNTRNHSTDHSHESINKKSEWNELNHSIMQHISNLYLVFTIKVAGALFINRKLHKTSNLMASITCSCAMHKAIRSVFGTNFSHQKIPQTIISFLLNYSFDNRASQRTEYNNGKNVYLLFLVHSANG